MVKIYQIKPVYGVSTDIDEISKLKSAFDELEDDDTEVETDI